MRKNSGAMRVAAVMFGLAALAGVTQLCLAGEPRAAKAINHVGIASSNIERTIHFYRDLIGMELLGPVSSVDDQPTYNHIFGLEKVKAKAAMLKLGTMQLEVWEFERPRGRAADPQQPVNNPRINHICFEVDDVQAMYDRLKTAGVTFHYPPQVFENADAKAVYGRDPDGNVFELLQWLKTPEQ